MTVDLSFAHDMDRFFNRVFAPMRQMQMPVMKVLPVDLSEKDGAYTLTADVQGFTEDEIGVELHGRSLRVVAETKLKETNDDGDRNDGTTVHLAERETYRRMERVLALPRKVDEEGVTATLENGVLRLTMPIAEAEQPRKIQIQTGNSQPEIEGKTG